MLCASSGVASARSLAAIFGICARDWKSEKWLSFEKMTMPFGEGPKGSPFLPSSVSLVTTIRVHAPTMLSKFGAPQGEAKSDGDESLVHFFTPTVEYTERPPVLRQAAPLPLAYFVQGKAGTKLQRLSQIGACVA